MRSSSNLVLNPFVGTISFGPPPPPFFLPLAFNAGWAVSFARRAKSARESGGDLGKAPEEWGGGRADSGARVRGRIWRDEGVSGGVDERG